MIGQQMGVGITGTVVGVLQVASDPRRVVVVVQCGQDRYLVGRARLTADGELPEEWTGGHHDLTLQRAWQVAGERCGWVEQP